MTLQVGSLVKPFLTDWTVMWGFPNVKYLMHCKCSRLTKTFSAVCALKRFVLRMNILMVSQMILPSESFSTDITREWSLVCVSPFMDEQVVTLSKLSITILAYKPFLGPARPLCARVEPGMDS